VPTDPLSTRGIPSRSFLLVLGWIALTAILIGVGQVIVHSPAIDAFDRHVTRWVVAHRSPGLDAAMKAVTWIGSWVATVVVAAVVLVLAWTKRLTMAALLVLAVAWAGEWAMVNLVKVAVGRHRPPEALWLVKAHGASFPSGHAANATLVCTAAAAVTFLLTRRRSARATAVVLASVAVVAVLSSRVELGVHWTTDVVVGCLVTVTWLVAVAWLAATAVPLAPTHVPAGDPGSRRPLPHPTAVEG